MLGLASGTTGFSEPEQLTQHKPKRLIEGFVCNPLLPAIFAARNIVTYCRESKVDFVLVRPGKRFHTPIIGAVFKYSGPCEGLRHEACARNVPFKLSIIVLDPRGKPAARVWNSHDRISVPIAVYEKNTVIRLERKAESRNVVTDFD